MAVVTHLYADGTERQRTTIDHRLGRPTAAEPYWGAIVIRMATAGDRPALERLAELDSTERPGGAVLIAHASGRPVAAVSVSDGRAIADPFVATGDVVELLRVRAGQLRHSRR